MFSEPLFLDIFFHRPPRHVYHGIGGRVKYYIPYNVYYTAHYYEFNNNIINCYVNLWAGPRTGEINESRTT